MNGTYACYFQQSLPRRHSYSQLTVVVSKTTVSNCVESHGTPIEQLLFGQPASAYTAQPAEKPTPPFRLGDQRTVTRTVRPSLVHLLF